MIVRRIAADPIDVQIERMPGADGDRGRDSLFVQLFRGETEFLSTSVFRGATSNDALELDSRLSHDELIRVQATLVLEWLRWPVFELKFAPATNEILVSQLNEAFPIGATADSSFTEMPEEFAHDA